MPSVLSISRPRKGPSKARETRSCAAQTSAMALSPSISDRRVLSTTSVSNKALITLIAQSADAALCSGEGWAFPSLPAACRFRSAASGRMARATHRFGHQD
jgi:hypothetical protein